MDNWITATRMRSAFYALLNVRRPPTDSDAYKTMDVYPEAAGIIGDNFLTFLDWQTVVLSLPRFGYQQLDSFLD